MPSTFKPGDKAALSAAFLRSIDPAAAKGWPTRYDLGIGTVFMTVDCGGIVLVDIWFPERQVFRRVNSVNLVHATDIYSEAMRAEHRPRRA